MTDVEALIDRAQRTHVVVVGGGVAGLVAALQCAKVGFRVTVLEAVSYTHLDVYKRQGKDPWPRAGAHAKIAGFAHGKPMMDIEHVNSIGTLLADLSARTEQLRGYL